jgi:signal transduction histidine kinase
MVAWCSTMVRRDPHELVAIASHDLSEPLRTVEGFARVLQDRAADRLDERERDLLAEVVAGTERMRVLLDAVLDWSRLQGGAGRRELVDARALVEEVVRGLGARVRETGASVAVGDLPAVWGDRSQLGQVFQNLVANALTHGGPGSQVEVGAAAEGNGWRFAVADRGPGVPEAEREAIFGLFRRGAAGTDGAGAGIGLAACAQIVANHGGRIWVEPRPGGGSVFAFTLPQRSSR